MENRIIKFRGKNIHTGEWLYGDYHREGKTHYITKPEQYLREYAPIEFIVDGKTVGQFTGLLDKNGTEIYEGDILRLGDSDSGVCEVGWSESVSAYCIRFHFEAALGLKPLGSWKECERVIVVIGNIHDNPSLISNKQ